MENPSNADLDMIEALLATMQQNPSQLYEEVDDDDDDDDDYDDEDDDDDDAYYGEHTIHTMLNPYGGGDGEMAGDGQMQMPNVQTMNFLQGLLNMNNSSLSGMAEIEAAMGSGLAGMGSPMDGGSGGFLPTMQSLLPNMGSEMAGALAGAFAGGMNSLMEYNHPGGHDQGNHDDYDDDDDDDDDDDVLSDEEDEDDDDDDDDDDDIHHKHGIDPSSMMLGGVGGLMAASLLANATNMASPANPPRNYQDNFHPPALMPPPSSALPMLPPSSGAPPAGFCIPTSASTSIPSSAPMISPAVSTTATSIAATPLGTMSGGTVSKADPLAALAAGLGGAAIGAGVLAPIVSNLLGNSGGTTVVNNKLIPSNSSITPVIGNNDSFNKSGRNDPDSVDGIVASLAVSKISNSNTPKPTPLNAKPSQPLSNTPITKIQTNEPQTKSKSGEGAKQNKEESDDDKASLDSASSSSSETSGGGKSDTESVGKKTPPPLSEGSESTSSQEVGSYASIPDLASATESMRDSDTDNHSEAHNVTANLSDIDSDVQEQKPIPVNQYQVGPLPVVVERPTYGWGSMLGLDTAKEALKSLFIARSFPAVFEGTEGSCKGILLFGPSGSGKTCLARALANEANNALFVGINSRYLLLNHNPIEAVQVVKCMFDQARREKPTVILFDEIEALCYQANDKSAALAKEEILAQVKGLSTISNYPARQDASSINDGILVLGTTNQPWLLEEKLRRVFTYNIHVKLPSEKPRHGLFRMFLHNLAHNINEEEFQCLVSKSEGYSAADINTVIRQAAHRVPLDPSKEPGHRGLTYDDLATVMTHYRCRFNDDQKQKYASYIAAATHKAAEDLEDNSKEKKDKPKGVKKISHRIAKSLAAAVLAVID